MSQHIPFSRLQTLVTLVFLCALMVLCARASRAQTTGPATPDGVTIMVLPPTGDPNTIAIVPNGSRTTAISAASGNCNLPVTPGPVGTVINPGNIGIDDPFHSGRQCTLSMPIGLADAPALRAVAVFTATCTPVGQQGPQACPSVRSAVAGPFVVQSVTTAPGPPTGLHFTP